MSLSGIQTISGSQTKISIESNVLHPLTSFFLEVVNTAVAISTEVYSIGFYFPYLYLKGYSEPFNYYGLNPTVLSEKQSNLPAIFFLHGDKHNQSAVLPLARKIDEYCKQLKQSGQASNMGAMFSMNLYYDDDHPERYWAKFKDKINEVKTLYGKEGKPLELILVGHSKGATVAADYAYCHFNEHSNENIEIKKVISIAGRLQVIPSKWRGCADQIKEQVGGVYQAILNHPEIPLYNVVASKDWIMDPESSFINKDKNHSLYVENRSHLGVLSSSRVLDQVVKWLHQDDKPSQDRC